MFFFPVAQRISVSCHDILLTPYSVFVCDCILPDTEFEKLVEHPSMMDVKDRSIFIHVDLPGQEDRAPDLPDE